MSPIDIKRKQLELIKVSAARAELEFRIMEREEEIERIKANIEIQIKKEIELKKELDDLK